MIFSLRWRSFHTGSLRRIPFWVAIIFQSIMLHQAVHGRNWYGVRHWHRPLGRSDTINWGNYKMTVDNFMYINTWCTVGNSAEDNYDVKCCTNLNTKSKAQTGTTWLKHDYQSYYFLVPFWFWYNYWHPSTHSDTVCPLKIAVIDSYRLCHTINQI